MRQEKESNKIKFFPKKIYCDRKIEDLLRFPILQKKRVLALRSSIYGEFHFNADHYADTRVLRRKKKKPVPDKSLPEIPSYERR